MTTPPQKTGKKAPATPDAPKQHPAAPHVRPVSAASQAMELVRPKPSIATLDTEPTTPVSPPDFVSGFDADFSGEKPLLLNVWNRDKGSGKGFDKFREFISEVGEGRVFLATDMTDDGRKMFQKAVDRGLITQVSGSKGLHRTTEWKVLGAAPDRGSSIRSTANSLAEINPAAKLASTKVVDENGVPKRVFHGTGQDWRFGGWKRREYEEAGTGYYFTESPEASSRYAELSEQRGFGSSPQVRASYLDIKNPLVHDDLVSEHDFIKAMAALDNSGGDSYEIKRIWNAGPTDWGRLVSMISKELRSPDSARQLLDREFGFDGETYRESIVTSTGEKVLHNVWVARSQSQINPAILTPAARDALFKKLLAQGIPVLMAMAMVAMRDSGDDVAVEERRPANPLELLFGPMLRR